EVDDHLPARVRAAGLEEADVAGRDARLQGQLELAAPAPSPPLAQQRGDTGPGHGTRGLGRHQRQRTRVGVARPITSEVMAPGPLAPASPPSSPLSPRSSPPPAG